jgi:hypothetical protein
MEFRRNRSLRCGRVTFVASIYRSGTARHGARLPELPGRSSTHPGDGHSGRVEQFFEDVTALNKGLSHPDFARVEQLIQSYGMELLGPTSLVMNCDAARFHAGHGIA